MFRICHSFQFHVVMSVRCEVNQIISKWEDKIFNTTKQWAIKCSSSWIPLFNSFFLPPTPITTTKEENVIKKLLSWCQPNIVVWWKKKLLQKDRCCNMNLSIVVCLSQAILVSSLVVYDLIYQMGPLYVMWFWQTLTFCVMKFQVAFLGVLTNSLTLCVMKLKRSKWLF